MSFKQNDNNTTIHLGNYEEFFILYMDNELSDEQMKKVDEFLDKHPDLRAEFEILLSTKLPMEEFSMNKEDLLAENMKISPVEEDILLYIDNELDPGKKKIVELELASNNTYAVQHQLLMKTRLDATETIPYPNKEELYHYTERVISLRFWMRIAAAVIVTASAGILYFTGTGSKIQNGPEVSVQPAPVTKQPAQQPGVPSSDPANQTALAKTKPAEEKTLDKIEPGKTVETSVRYGKQADHQDRQVQQLARNDEPANTNTPEKTYTSVASLTESIQAPKMVSETIPAIDPVALAKSQTVNKSIVTSFPAERKTDIDTAPKDDVAKGSVKGFLRKATRLIEKRTGIDPTNEDGELLIAAVALKLK